MWRWMRHSGDRSDMDKSTGHPFPPLSRREWGDLLLYNVFMTDMVLMATLGGKAQLITLALDCLLEQGSRPEQVVVFHTRRDRPQTASALHRLEQDAALDAQSADLRFVELRDPQGALPDVIAPEEQETAFRVIFAELRDAKLQGKRVHLLIAGGRRTLAVFGMAAAQMLFDDEDRLWHLASHPGLEASGALHAGPGEWSRLIRIPVIAWGRLSPVFDTLRQVEDPFSAVEKLNMQRLHDQWNAARIFAISYLTPAERNVVEGLVRMGRSQAEIASDLSLSPRTVEQHLRAVYRKAADYWELEDVNQAQLVRLLNLYFLAEGPAGDPGG